MKNLKDKMYKGLAVATMAALPAIALAEDANLMQSATTEIGALKTGIIGFGVVVIGIGIAFATIRLAKRGVNQA